MYFIYACYDAKMNEKILQICSGGFFMYVLDECFDT